MKSIAGAVAAAMLAGTAMAQTPLPPAGQKPAKAIPATIPLWQTIRDPARMPYTKETGRLKVGDAELYYAVYGKGRPVILLHDALGNADHWGNQVGPLSQSHQVIVLDTRGHGRSSRGESPYSYALMAEDVLQVMQKLGLREASIVGWGDGAVVGLDLAIRHPGRVTKLVMFGGNYDLSGLKPGAEQTPTFAAYARKAIADYRKLSPDPDFDGLFASLRAMWAREPAYTKDQLRQVKTPTTVLIADYEETVKREHSEDMGQLIPAAHVVVLPSVSHFAPWQNSRRFNDVLMAVLDL